uniref:Secreted protein n=1 Tax=Rhipicephalus appendiculatus TaxID=34631 RepID=A0A131YRW0_RHIAP
MRTFSVFVVIVGVVFAFILSTNEKLGPSVALAVPIPEPNPGFGLSKPRRQSSSPKKPGHKRPRHHQAHHPHPRNMSNADMKRLAAQLQNPQHHQSRTAFRTT